MSRPAVLFFTGPAACGKGTMSELLLKKSNNFAHISVGDILRWEAADKDSPFSSQINAILEAGHIVPSDLAMFVLRRWIEKKASEGAKCVIIDGFPRAMDQYMMFQQELGLPDAVIHMETQPEVCLARSLERARQAIANGEKPRSDDNEEKFRIRYAAYQNTTIPVIEHIKKENSGVYCFVDATPSIEDVFAQVLNILNSKNSLKECLA
ncbi:hypothetical protein RCL1_004096 [Eukaryota sp. TZLM3-RCL]